MRTRLLIVHVVLFTCSRPGAAKLPVRTALLRLAPVGCDVREHGHGVDMDEGGVQDPPREVLLL